MAVVIVVIPIMIIVPAVSVFIPPTMALVPAAFPRLVARMVGLSAVPAMTLNGLVQFVVLLGDAPLTAIVVIGEGKRRRDKRQQANERGCCEQRPAQKSFLSEMNHHVLSILP